MRLPSPQLISDCHFFRSGAVTVHASAAIAPGVILQADANAHIIIGAGVSIGAGSVIHAYSGAIELESGVTLGTGVLILGQSQIGANACVGAMTTIMDCSIAATQMVAPGSLLGDRSRSVAIDAEPAATTAPPPVTPTVTPTVTAVGFQETVSGASFFSATVQREAIDSGLNPSPHSSTFDPDHSPYQARPLTPTHVEPIPATSPYPANPFQDNHPSLKRPDTSYEAAPFQDNHPSLNNGVYKFDYLNPQAHQAQNNPAPVNQAQNNQAQNNQATVSPSIAQNQPSHFSQPNSSNQPNPYSQPNSSNQPNPYNQPNSSNQPNPYSQPNSSNQPNPYNQPNSYSQPNPYNQNNSFNSNPPNGSTSSNPASSNNPSDPAGLATQTSGSALVDRKTVIYGKEHLQRMLGSLFPHRQPLDNQTNNFQTHNFNDRNGGTPTGT